MDLEAFKEAMVKALKSLPPDLARDLAQVIHFLVARMPVIEKVGPQVWPILSNHVMALATQGIMGMLDTDGLDKALTEAFAEVGIDIPRAAA